MPAPDAPLVLPALAAALGAWRARFWLLSLGVGAVLATNAPVQLAQRAAARAMERATAGSAAMDPASMGPQEAQAILRDAFGGCCALCGSLAVTVFLVMPVAAGAAVAGARAVRGTARASDLGAGFRRYGPTLVVTLVTLLVGGGAAVAVGLVGSSAALGTASRTLSSVLSPAVVLGAVAILCAVTLWLTARLWFATIRAADPDRPRIGGVAACIASWEWTSGPVQWPLLGLVAAMAALAVAGAVPGMALAQAAGRAAEGTAAASALQALSVAADLGSAWLVGSALLACLGAAYERLAAAHEPAMPPSAVPPGAGTGLDA